MKPKAKPYTESVIRPTLTDPYMLELKYFYDVIVRDISPKTTPEDYKDDLRLFKMIMETLQNKLTG